MDKQSKKSNTTIRDLHNCVPVDLNLFERHCEDLRSRISHFALMLDILATVYKLQSV